VESLICEIFLASFGDTDKHESEGLCLSIKQIVDCVILDGQLGVLFDILSAELGPSTAS